MLRKLIMVAAVVAAIPTLATAAPAPVTKATAALTSLAQTEAAKTGKHHKMVVHKVKVRGHVKSAKNAALKS